DPAPADPDHGRIRDERALPGLRHGRGVVGRVRRHDLHARRAARLFPLEALALVERLWAPWRLEYITSADETPGCVFCRALEGEEEESLVVHRGERAFVLLNKFPYASGHLMVAPLRHVGEYAELRDDEAVDIHRLTQSSMQALAQAYAPQGYNLGWNLGRIAGA